MFRKLLVVSLALSWVILAASARAEEKGEAKGKKPAKAKKAPFVHAVIFILKKDAPKGEVDALIADTHKLLAKISSVRGIWVGRPSDKGTPMYAKKHDLGLLVLFDDADGLKQYLEDELHLEFVKKHLEHIDIEKMSVFDFVNQKAAK